MRRALLLLCLLLAGPMVLAQGALPSWSFKKETQGWTAPLTGTVSSKDGQLIFRYDQVVGQIPVVMVEGFEPPAKATHLGLSVLASHGQIVLVGLKERDGSSYLHDVTGKSKTWSDLQLALDAFHLDRNALEAQGRSDENGRLDPDQIASVVLGDPAGVLAAVLGEPRGSAKLKGVEIRLRKVAFQRRKTR